MYKDNKFAKTLANQLRGKVDEIKSTKGSMKFKLAKFRDLKAASSILKERLEKIQDLKVLEINGTGRGYIIILQYYGVNYTVETDGYGYPIYETLTPPNDDLTIRIKDAVENPNPADEATLDPSSAPVAKPTFRPVSKKIKKIIRVKANYKEMTDEDLMTKFNDCAKLINEGKGSDDIKEEMGRLTGELISRGYAQNKEGFEKAASKKKATQNYVVYERDEATGAFIEIWAGEGHVDVLVGNSEETVETWSKDTEDVEGSSDDQDIIDWAEANMSSEFIEAKKIFEELKKSNHEPELFPPSSEWEETTKFFTSKEEAEKIAKELRDSGEYDKVGVYESTKDNSKRWHVYVSSGPGTARFYGVDGKVASKKKAAVATDYKGFIIFDTEKGKVYGGQEGSEALFEGNSISSVKAMIDEFLELHPESSKKKAAPMPIIEPSQADELPGSGPKDKGPRSRGNPKSDIERVMQHYEVDEEEAKAMMESNSIDELLPPRGSGRPDNDGKGKEVIIPEEHIEEDVERLEIILERVEDIKKEVAELMKDDEKATDKDKPKKEKDDKFKEKKPKEDDKDKKESFKKKADGEVFKAYLGTGSVDGRGGPAQYSIDVRRIAIPKDPVAFQQGIDKEEINMFVNEDNTVDAILSALNSGSVYVFQGMDSTEAMTIGMNKADVKEEARTELMGDVSGDEEEDWDVGGL